MENSSFDYRQSIDFQTLPELTPEEMEQKLARALSQDWRLLSLFGLPEEAAKSAFAPPQQQSISLVAILAQDETQCLTALRSHKLTSWPSFTLSCPQTHYFEREIFEQWGATPLGHPWLKPVRRIPDTFRSKGTTEQVDYPYYRVEGCEVHEVAVGPVHAGIIEPGHFRFQCYGEEVMHLEIALGYQHRGLEARLAYCPAQQRISLVECLAGDSSIAHASAHCVLWERLAGISVGKNAQLIRRIALELERLANHCGDLGAIAGDTGFLPTASWNGRIRGDFLNITALLCGNRFGRNLIAYGGVRQYTDVTLCKEMTERVGLAGRDARGAVDVMLGTASVLHRLDGTGALNATQARQLGLVGVPARACGLNLDARFHAPLSDLPLLKTPCIETSGDVLARSLVRSRELDISIEMVLADLECLSSSPADTLAVPCSPVLPAGRLAVAQVEGWRGEICHIAVTGSQGQILAYKLIDPSFHNWPGLALALRGEQISDFPLCNKSFNLSYCGHDL